MNVSGINSNLPIKQNNNVEQEQENTDNPPKYSKYDIDSDGTVSVEEQRQIVESNIQPSYDEFHELLDEAGFDFNELKNDIAKEYKNISAKNDNEGRIADNRVFNLMIYANSRLLSEVDKAVAKREEENQAELEGIKNDIEDSVDIIVLKHMSGTDTDKDKAEAKELRESIESLSGAYPDLGTWADSLIKKLDDVYPNK